MLLARQPQLWLLDEPHAGLDAEHRELLDGLLKEVTAAGATVIAASHEERTSEVLADRVVTMSGGTVLDGVLADPPAAERARFGRRPGSRPNRWAGSGRGATECGLTSGS